MTDSDVVTARPPDSPPPGPEWKPIPGAPGYEASHRGKVRSINRMQDGKRLTGKEMSQRLQNRTRDGDTVYKLTDVRRDNGSKWTSTVQMFVMLAHAGSPPPGMEICHGAGGPLDNRWPENLSYNTKVFNEGMKVRPVREPEPPRLCINHDRCGGVAVPRGRRCAACRTQIGRSAAIMFANGADPEQVADALDYGSANGVYRLAVQHGMRIRVTQRHRLPRARRLLSVTLRREGSRPNSDAQ